MFAQDMKTFFKSKTNWTGLTMIGTGIVGYFTKTMTPVAAFQTAATGLGLICLKDATFKVGQ